jgi:hypothetical protein
VLVPRPLPHTDTDQYPGRVSRPGRHGGFARRDHVAAHVQSQAPGPQHRLVGEMDERKRSRRRSSDCRVRRPRRGYAGRA